jgi:hypothetical protein
MLSVIMLNVIMLSVIMPSVIMLRVVSPSAMSLASEKKVFWFSILNSLQCRRQLWMLVRVETPVAIQMINRRSRDT